MNDLKDLEQLLGVKYQDVAQGQKRIDLPKNGYCTVNEKQDPLGTTRLMKAAMSGDLQLVDFLIICGAEVNACDVKMRTAIDYALDGENPEVVLLLLHQRSLLPQQLTEERLSTRFKDLVDQHEGLKNFFKERDSFHHILIDQETEHVKETLETHKDECDPPRYLIDSNGESALYKALSNKKYDTWALLRASGFAYATEKERSEARTSEQNKPFIDAIGNHFGTLEGCHVQKMVAKSRIYKCIGVDVQACTRKVKSYFMDMDEDEYTSTLLKCLQDDPSLKIIFDFNSEDIQGVHPFKENGHMWGLTELKLNRIYVTAKETKEFNFRDIVSNLAHECAHKTYALVFENGGLPYRKEDTEGEEEYLNVVNAVLSDERKEKCDVIIQRAAKYNPMHELIVRVPEIISKYMKEIDDDGSTMSGISRLEKEAPELLTFYDEWVQSELMEYIRMNSTAGKFRMCDWLRTTLLSDYCDDKIQVNGSLDKPHDFRHNLLSVLKVSNLKLGVSHLKLSLKEVTVVDWTRYHKDTEIFKLAVRRNEIKKLAIVWDNADAPWFCKSSVCRSGKCIGKQLQEDVLRSTILIIPKKFSVLRELKSIDYSWNDLSDSTRTWILDKELHFGGSEMMMEDLIESISPTDSEVFNVHKITPESFIDVNLLSELIDEESIVIGRSLISNLEEREAELMQKHRECFIQRRIMVSNIDFNRDTFKRRANDAFFISKVSKTHLEKVGFGQVSVWNSEETPQETRCFILSGEPSSGGNTHIFRDIAEKLRDWNSTKGGNWHFVHFFEFVYGEYTLIGSLNCRHVSHNGRNTFEDSGTSLFESDSKPNEVLLVADAPGSGKSVFVNNVALEVKEKCNMRWVDVIELQLFENNFKKWIESNVMTPESAKIEDNSKKWNESIVMTPESAKDLLYDLIKTGSSYIEKTFYKFFFSNTNKLFIFFDGFDEICPNYREIVTNLIVVLTNATSIKVCLTTRVHESAELEDRLSTLAYKFVPFDRAEQRRFLNLEWNASLSYLSPEGKREKIREIISALQPSDDLRERNFFPKLLENLTSLSEEDLNAKSQSIDFDEVADDLMDMGESTVEENVYFSENPLHAWMLAYVAFEKNFAIGKSYSLWQVYDKFVKIKIDIYSRLKARNKEYVAGDAKERGFKENMYKILKEFSVYYFLDDEDFELDERDLHDMLRVGLISRKRNSNVFVHRTLGEYIFSLWLLDEITKKQVTKVWLSNVLLEKKFDKVRQFINSKLLIGCKGMSNLIKPANRKRPYKLNDQQLGDLQKQKMFVESIQKCMYMSILECHLGITNLLSESYSKLLIDIMFRTAEWDFRTLEWPIVHENGEWNAFTFCGRCIRGKEGIRYSEQIRPKIYSPDEFARSRVECKVSRQSQLDYLKILTELLQIIEKYDLTMQLESIISREGLLWMGFNEDLLWRSEMGKGYYEFLLKFLARNSSKLSETLRDKLLERDNNGMFINGAVFLFETFRLLIETIFEESNLNNLIINHKNMLDAWINIFQDCGVKDVERMWKYLEDKLKDEEDRRKILQWIDSRHRNAIYSACANWEHHEVLPFVWHLCQRVMDRKEFRKYLFDSFSRTMDSIMLKVDRLLGCVSDMVASGNLDLCEAVRLLQLTDEKGKHYLLTFNGNYSPNSLFKFQKFIATQDLSIQKILENMGGHYYWLVPSCFEYLDQYNMEEGFISEVESEFRQILPRIEAFPFVDPIQIDQQGYFLDILDEYGRRIKGIHLKMFLVLLRRQLKLEVELLSEGQFKSRIKEFFIWIYKVLPPTINVGGHVKTRGFLIPLIFALLSEYLSKEQLRNILFCRHSVWGNIFDCASRKNDDTAYQKCVEITRWTKGEGTQ